MIILFPPLSFSYVFLPSSWVLCGWCKTSHYYSHMQEGIEKKNNPQTIYGVRSTGEGTPILRLGKKQNLDIVLLTYRL